MNRTGIEWTSFSANPLKYRDAVGRVVWGCVHKSDGCRHCYSEALAKRYGRGGPFTAQVMRGLTPFLDEAEVRHMRTAGRIGGLSVSGGLCFVGDMTDLFGEWVPDELLNRLFSEVLERRTDVTWQLLTKRAQRLRAYLGWRWDGGRIPSRNIHVGVSVEDQKTADERIPLLLQTPAAVRFVSQEPQLAPICHRDAWFRGICQGCGAEAGTMAPHYRGSCDCGGQVVGIDQLIIGGESGPHARPFDVAWARSVVRQCRGAGVACFVKQMGSNVRTRNDSLATENPPDDPRDWPEPAEGWHDGNVQHNLDGYREEYQGAPVRIRLKSAKGGDPSEWPADLRVREFPK